MGEEYDAVEVVFRDDTSEHIEDATGIGFTDLEAIVVVERGDSVRYFYPTENLKSIKGYAKKAKATVTPFPTH